MKKILILSANPKNTNSLRLDEEVREIKNTIQLSPNRDEFQIITESAVRVDDLTRFLSHHQPTIVHFCGHGTGADGLALEDNFGQMQLVSTQALAKLFDLFQQQVECVLLNACYSESQATAIHQHIDCVVGMNQAIGDKAAIKFSVGFYTALAAGMNYEDCFHMGCTSIDLQGISESLTPVIKIRRRHYQTVVKENTGGVVSKESTAKEESNSQPQSGGISQSVSGGTIYGSVIGSQRDNNQQITNVQSINTSEQQQNLVEIANHIKILLQRLEQDNPSQTNSQKMIVVAKAVEEIENNPTFKTRVIGALKVGGIEAFKRLINHPLVNIFMAAIDGWEV